MLQYGTDRQVSGNFLVSTQFGSTSCRPVSFKHLLGECAKGTPNDSDFIDMLNRTFVPVARSVILTPGLELSDVLAASLGERGFVSAVRSKREIVVPVGVSRSDAIQSTRIFGIGETDCVVPRAHSVWKELLIERHGSDIVIVVSETDVICSWEVWERRVIGDLLVQWWQFDAFESAPTHDMLPFQTDWLYGPNESRNDGTYYLSVRIPNAVTIRTLILIGEVNP